MARWSKEVRSRFPQLLRAMDEHDLLTAASAIAFQILLALVPLVLFLVSLLGLLDFGDVWVDNVAKGVRPEVSPEVFQVLDHAVKKVVADKEIFWATGGLALAVWEASAAVRGVMVALDRVYQSRERRGFAERYRVSIVLAVIVGMLIVAAVGVVRFVPVAIGADQPEYLEIASFVVRWFVAGTLLWLSVGVLVRHAPTAPQPIGWVSFGAGVVIVAWLVMSIAFGTYVSYLAIYDSIFGSFATLFVLMLYLYFSSAAFLVGLQLDAIIRTAHSGSPSAS